MSTESSSRPTPVQQREIAVNAITSGSEEELYDELMSNYMLSLKILEANGFPMVRITKSGHQGVFIATEHDRRFVAPSVELRNCIRCQKVFNISEYSTEMPEENCVYHWGKKPAKRDVPDRKKDQKGRTKDKKGIAPVKISPYEDKYFCCGLPYDSEGCTKFSYHVHNQIQRPSLHFDFRRTPKSRGPGDRRSKKVFSLDCEMVYTTGGCEIARVVMVDWKGEVVLDLFCRPENPVLDYNTFFSGISEEMLDGVEETLEDVKRVMFKYINQHTILIGHSLEFDLRALKLIHHNVVDTSMVFHLSHRHFKHSLKALSKMFLGLRIQETEHCPIEDSMAALHLVYVKVTHERKKNAKKPREEQDGGEENIKSTDLEK